MGGFQTVGVQKTNPVILSCSETHSAHSSIQFGVETKIDRGHSIIQGVPKNALSCLPSISRRLSIPDHQINWWLGMLASLKVRFLGHPVGVSENQSYFPFILFFLTLSDWMETCQSCNLSTTNRQTGRTGERLVCCIIQVPCVRRFVMF